MRLPHIKALTTAASKAANSHLMVVDTPKYFNTFKDEVYKKINVINSWYTRVIGLDEVKFHQDRVFVLQQKLLNVQEKRREIGTLLGEIRRKSNDLQEQIHKVKRQDDLQRFLDLMREETETLKQENEITEMFTNCDREEREIFTAFTNAIRDSHEKQRAQLEYTKYLGLILSITGSFLAFMYSTLKKNDLKDFIETHVKEMSLNSGEAGGVLSASLVKTVEENQKKNEAVLNAVMQSHRQLLHVINSRKPVSPTDFIPIESNKNLNQMPDGEKLLWFSVLSLVGLMILKKIFN